MPKWLVPWVVPIVLVVVVVVLSVSSSWGPVAALIGYVLLVGAAIGALAWWRIQYLKDHPEPELTHRPFWRL